MATTPVAALGGTGERTDREIVSEALVAEYEVQDELGRGGMALVYQAHERELGREVAVKVLPFALGFDAEFVERFQREARTAAQLEHPNIIPIYRVGRAGRGHLLRHEVPARRIARRAAAEARPPHGAGDTPPPGGLCQRPRVRAPARHRASRHEAGQRDVR